MTSEETELAGCSDPDVQARSWLVRLKSGEATQQDLDMLACWRSENEGNEESFRRAVRLWHALGPAIARGVPAAPVQSDVQAGMSRRWFLGGAAGLAATTAVMLAVGGISTPAGAQVFETRKGERRQLQLERQITVALNTNSRLFYWPDIALPRVKLDRGEAIIVANCASDRQLEVAIGDKQVLAQTARFLLRVEDERVKIACLEGDLTVRSGGKSYALTGGMNMQFRDDIVQSDEAPPSENALAWQKGLLQFKNKPAGEIIEELNRYRPGRVYLIGDRSNVRISGVIHLDRTDLAVDHIARSLDMKVTRLPGDLAILRGS